MRFMLLLKGDPEAGSVPDERLIGAMMRYSDELAKGRCAARGRGSAAECDQAPSISRQIGSRDALAQVFGWQAALAERAGRLHEAIEYLREAANLAAGLGFTGDLKMFLGNLARLEGRPRRHVVIVLPGRLRGLPCRAAMPSSRPGAGGPTSRGKRRTARIAR
jgi:hypothetical protein